MRRSLQVGRLASKLGRASTRVVAFILLLIGAATSTYLFFALKDTAQFRDRLITRRYEGSLSEDLGFLTAFTSEALTGFEFDSPEERARTERFRAHLARVRRALQGVHDQDRTAAPVDALAVDALALDVLTGRVAEGQPSGDGLLGTRALQELGLKPLFEEGLPGRACLHSDPEIAADSFVFVPAPLVGVQGPALDLPAALRRELVLSELVEPHLVELGAGLEPEDVLQVYFIPVSGFIRIHDPKAGDQAARYAKTFRPLMSFSDRTYFRESRRADNDDRFRRSAPYLDVTGGGLISTYSVYVDNPRLGLQGMIGVDRQLVPLETLRSRSLSLGAGLGPLRDFRYGFYSLGSRELDGAWGAGKETREKMIEELEADPRSTREGIRRIEHSGSGATVFTAPVGGDEVAYFLFEPRAVARKYRVLGLLYGFSLLGLGSMAILALYFQRATSSAERSREEILANLNGGFLVVNEGGTIRTATEKFRNLVEDPEPEGKTLATYFTRDTWNEYREHLEVVRRRDLDGRSGSAIANGEARLRRDFEFTGELRKADGADLRVIISSAPLLHEGAARSRMLILIPSAALELTIAKKFLHIFSHALKTPVHNLQLIADLFRRRKAYPKFDYYFSLMQHTVRDFSTLVDDVLRFSELDIKEVQPHRKPINLSQVLRGVVSSVRERAASQGLELDCHIPESLKIHADPDMLRVVFNNLVDNAIKYTERGGITVRANDLGGEVVVTFEDTGPGVPAEEREQIFELFFQGRLRQAGARGLGLGLYISRKYVELHGGRLHYEPVLGPPAEDGSETLRGSKLIVQLPKEFGRQQNGPEEREDPGLGG